jgi:hypothetical protein
MFPFHIGDHPTLDLGHRDLEVIVLAVKVTMVMGSLLFATFYIGNIGDFIISPSKKTSILAIAKLFSADFLARGSLLGQATLRRPNGQHAI